MTAAARSSSEALSRSEQRTRSTSHRPGAICASDVTRGAAGGAASSGDAAGSGGAAPCCCGAGDCAHAARQHVNRTATSLFSSSSPFLIRFCRGFRSGHLLRSSPLLRAVAGPAFGARQPIIASITSARTAGRAPTYCTAESTEARPDCGTAPSIARNRPDQSAPSRASCRTLKRPGCNGLARRT
jgi:hypothetical protein